ncbi:unnamed protein product [Allacma fusca]|uniref:Protein msta n=2 Tax=Allacma fusca TaxID=39272 RepID=A0A8J2J060_9HEXA|nr:unnamed protein product [Allacma fusca]
MESKCEVCSKPAHQKCAGCLAVFYCSSTHQKEHWKSHQRSCSYFVIRDDPQLGRGFYASRDIKAGIIIHEEIPFVFAPSWPANTFSDVPYCVSCGVGSRHIEPTLTRCGKCKWPYCSLECQKVHTDNECQIFESKGLIFPPTSIQVMDIPDLLLMIRTSIAKKKHPGVFQEIFQLRSTSDEPDMVAGVHGDENIERALGCLSTFINAENLHVSSQDFKKLLKILRLNCYFTVDRAMQILENPFSRAPLSDYLYPKASQIQHSCVPNCSWVISWTPDFKIRVRTAVPIKKGDPLKVSYYLRAGIKNRMDRVQTIRFRLGQWCKCWRCHDPTELGTFASAITCSKKCRNKKVGPKPVGYMLPEDPLSLSYTSHWRCGTCGVRKVGYNVAYDIQKLGDTIFRMEMDCNSGSNTESLINYCKDLITKHSGKTVHPNHWIVQDATRTILKYLPAHCHHSMDLETSQYYVKCGLYLLGIQNIVSPGISYDRAILQKQIATALQDQVTELCSQKKYKEALSNIEQCLKLQKEALAYFKDDFPKNDGYISDVDEVRFGMRSATTSRDEISSMIDDEFKCVVCGKQAYQNCPQCHLVTYCSTEHRQKHWKSHRKSCSCFVIKEGSGSNKGFFALRNLEAGTVILEEAPVVYGPSWDISSFSASFCVTCGVEMHITEVSSPKRRCAKCNWPSCCLGCHLIHTENECKIFEMAGNKLNFPPVGHFTPGDIRDLVLIIRATVLKKKNPGIYQQILELQSDSTESDYNDYNVEGVFRLLGPLVNSDGANINQEEFRKLFKILRINCHSTAIVLPDYEIADSTIHKNDIQDIVSPGSTLPRANLQKQIATALLQKHVQKELHNQKRHQEALDNLQHCLKLLTEACNYYEGSESRRSIATDLKMEIYRTTAASKVLAQALATKRSN